ncbi:hypothetical protein EG327_007011 [Venturia inaequalis]|uniref:Uncharacterized protein n=1 Tax=Venturia inaequalis TaxID=5025 RepID=A0A8H3Z3M9_VENIN|nr:hypothetical protein EG327_007011 [Venturia inaequalis]
MSTMTETAPLTTTTPTDNNKIPSLSLSLPTNPSPNTTPTLNPAKTDTLPTSSDPLPEARDPNPEPETAGTTTTFAPGTTKALEREIEEKKTPFWKRIFQSSRGKREEKMERERLEREVRSKRRASRSEVYGG